MYSLLRKNEFSDMLDKASINLKKPFPLIFLTPFRTNNRDILAIRYQHHLFCHFIKVNFNYFPR